MLQDDEKSLSTAATSVFNDGRYEKIVEEEHDNERKRELDRASSRVISIKKVT